MCTLAELVRVIDITVKGKSASPIVLYLGIGKIQIQCSLSKKILILGSWKAGTNNKLQYLAAKQSKNGDLNWLPQGYLHSCIESSYIVSCFSCFCSFSPCSPCLLCHGCKYPYCMCMSLRPWVKGSPASFMTGFHCTKGW